MNVLNLANNYINMIESMQRTGDDIFENF